MSPLAQATSALVAGDPGSTAQMASRAQSLTSTGALQPLPQQQRWESSTEHAARPRPRPYLETLPHNGEPYRSLTATKAHSM